jgi:hypothetical protein
MKSRFGFVLLLVTAACGCWALTVLAGAQDGPTPPTPPAPSTSIRVAPVPPLPSVPFSAAMPAAPAAPAAPPMSPVPAMPAAPAVPPIPAMPGWFDGDQRHSVSMSGGHREPASDCSDLHVRLTTGMPLWSRKSAR